ncbi:protein MLN51 homolog isoform X2 [Silene latifolia]|uniref:protein MLN51 homolog isoform X2 n=1 Tax=Silene latifolia TaxID=37657 RepID=UPI003D770D48
MGDEEDHLDYETDPDEVKLSLNMRRREASDDENDVVHDARSQSVDSGAESDDQGGAADYDDDDSGDEDEVYYDEYEEDEVVEVYSEVEGEREIRVQEEVNVAETGSDTKSKVKGQGEGEEAEEKVDGEESEKKEAEPFSVPTSGAFYMHDDRFRGNAAARHRRTFDGKKLWESKDEKKWGHDKFEELSLQDRHYDEGRRSSSGSYRGRGKARGASSGYSRGSRGRGYSGDKNQNAPPKDVRGRGPRRYQRLLNSKGDTQPTQYKESARSFEKSSHTGSRRTATSTGSSNVEHEAASAKRVGSNLSSASPPFYPSGASAKDIASTQKKEMQTGNHNRNMHPSADPNFSMPISNPILRGKNVVDPMGMDRLHIGDTISPANSKAIDNLHLQSSESSSLSPTKLAHPQVQGRVVASSKPSMFQPSQMNNQAPGQQLTQRTLLASQSLSPPKAVMQFGGQHPGGMGVPAVGMAFPGYVAQPNGLGSSEMTWLPMLANAAGAMGATYCPPYLPVDGSFHSRPSGQTSALPAPGKDNSLSKPNNEIKPQHRSEVANDGFRQRQNKPRRYSEMSFSQ